MKESNFRWNIVQDKNFTIFLHHDNIEIVNVKTSEKFKFENYDIFELKSLLEKTISLIADNQ